MKETLILISLLLVLASCSSSQVETWRMMEIPFNSKADYSATGAEVRLEWFNPRTGETMPAVEATVKADGSLVLPQRPDVEDWTLTVLI